MTGLEFPHPKDKLLLLRRLPVFSGCTERQLLLIADRTRLVEYKKGEVVYREGGEANAFYIVVSGRLRIARGKGEEKKSLPSLFAPVQKLHFTAWDWHPPCSRNEPNDRNLPSINSRRFRISCVGPLKRAIEPARQFRQSLRHELEPFCPPAFEPFLHLQLAGDLGIHVGVGRARGWPGEN